MNSDKVLDYFKVPYFFQDVMYLMSGIVNLFILNFLIKINLSDIPNYWELNDVVKSVIFLSLAYFIGRASVVLGGMSVNIVIKILFFIFNPSNVIYDKIVNDFRNLKLYVSGANRKIVPDYGIGHELNCFINENDYLRKNNERNRYAVIFTHLFLGGLEIIFIFRPSLLFAVLIISFALYIVIDSFKYNEYKFMLGGKLIANNKKN